MPVRCLSNALERGAPKVRRDRALDVGRILEVRRAAIDGARVRSLAAAYGVSVRTIYRALEGELLVQDVAEGWMAVWQLMAGRPPRLLGLVRMVGLARSGLVELAL